MQEHRYESWIQKIKIITFDNWQWVVARAYQRLFVDFRASFKDLWAVLIMMRYIWAIIFALQAFFSFKMVKIEWCNQSLFYVRFESRNFFSFQPIVSFLCGDDFHKKISYSRSISLKSCKWYTVWKKSI